MRPLATVLLPLCLAIAGCSDTDERFVPISLIPGDDGPTAPLATDASTPPAIRSATTAGLVGFDEQGRVIPALADRWIVTEDGTSYIFRLRNGVWPGGAPVRGEEVAASLRQRLRQLRGTPLGLDLSAVDEVRAMAGRVVEVRLSAAMPELLALLAQPELGLSRNGRGGGPMMLDQQGTVAQLEIIPPQRLGLPQQEDWIDQTRILRVRVEPAANAVARFDEGYSDLVLGGRTDTLPLVKTAGISRGTVRLDPVTGLFGLLFLNARGFFERPENREALAMAIDREALLAPFNVGGWVPTTRILPSELEGAQSTLAERWTDLTMDQRRQLATERVASWQASNGDVPPVRIALPDTPGGTMIHDRLRADLDAIGLSVRRVSENSAADLQLVDRVARYASGDWFFHQLSCVANREVCSEEADDLLAQARAAADPLVGRELRTTAEERLTAANAFVPFARPLRWSLVRADVTGFATNPRAVHPFLPLASKSR